MKHRSPTSAIIQARMTSSRLPGKVLKRLCGRPLLARVIERVQRFEGIDSICVAMPEGPEHEPIAGLVREFPGVAVVRGPEDDVLARYVMAADAVSAQSVVRITSDCPLLDPVISSAIISLYHRTGVDYARNDFDAGFPRGLDTEIISAEALRAAHAETADPYEREHVTAFVWRRPKRFPDIQLCRRPDLRHWRLCVDTPEDFRLVETIYERLLPLDPIFGLAAIEALIAAEPDLLKINENVKQTPYVHIEN